MIRAMSRGHSGHGKAGGSVGAGGGRARVGVLAAQQLATFGVAQVAMGSNLASSDGLSVPSASEGPALRALYLNITTLIWCSMLRI